MSEMQIGLVRQPYAHYNCISQWLNLTPTVTNRATNDKQLRTAHMNRPCHLDVVRLEK